LVVVYINFLFFSEIIFQCIESGNTFIEIVSNLVFDAACGVDESVSYNESDDPECPLNTWDEEDDGSLRISKQKKNEILDYWNGCKTGGRRKWSSMKTRYRFLNSVRQLYRWERQ